MQIQTLKVRLPSDSLAAIQPGHAFKKHKRILQRVANTVSRLVTCIGHYYDPGSFRVNSTNASRSTISDFDKKIHRMCINVSEHAVQNFAAIFSVLYLKTSGVTPF